MDTRPLIETTIQPTVLSAAFNQDSSCFAVGLDSGFSIFNSDPCQLRAERDFNGGIASVEMLGRANFVALVGGGKLPKFPENKVIIWDDAKQKAVISLDFGGTVRRVRMSRTRIVVALQNSVHVYAFSSPPKKISLFETADNPSGICCLTSKFIAFPGQTPGQVQLVEVTTGNVTIVPAHTSSLRGIEVSPDEEVMVTASETGTLIRIFATNNCAKIAELRRGMDPASIFSLAIAPSSQQLAVTSDKSTLHIFDIPNPVKTARLDSSSRDRRLTSSGNRGSSALSDDSSSQKWGILGKIPMLPRVFSDVYSFASARFEMGDDPPAGTSNAHSSDSHLERTRSVQGVIGWQSDQSLIIIGSGKRGRWEKYVIAEGKDGKRYCVRDGWKYYLAGAS